MSKISLHTQMLPDWVGEYLTRSGARYVKCIDNFGAYPGVVTLGRPYYDQSQVDARVMEGAVGADRIFDAVRPMIDKSPQVGIWETPANEASIWNDAVLNQYVPFNQRLIQRFHSIGKRIVVGAINVGWPRLESDDGGKQLHVVMLACQGADGISFHEGGRTDFEYPWMACRYRFFHDYCQQHGYGHPPIHITELALDVPGGPDSGHSGWRIILDGDGNRYNQILLNYEREIQKDDYVLSAHVFTTGGEGYGWASFEWDRDTALRFADLAHSIEPPPEPPEPPEPPQPGGEMDVIVIDATGKVRDTDYLRSQWGNVTWTESAVYGTLTLTEDFSGSSTTMVHLQDEDGKALPGREACYTWPDGRVCDTTNASGDVGFGWGGGSYYPHGGTGPMGIETGDVTVSGLGWLVLEDGSYTNHYHLNLALAEGEAEPQPPEPPEPPEYTVRGIDVSAWQEAIDWEAVKDSGLVDFAIIRASYAAEDGTTHEDSRFEYNRAECKRLGIPYGVYHYFRHDVNYQARDFVAIVGDDVPPLEWWLDCEESGLTGERVQRGLDAMRYTFGKPCNLYSNPNMMSRFDLEQDSLALWLAHYDVEEPDVPDGWAWSFWQYRVAPIGTIPGITTRIDLNYYVGTWEEFCEEFGWQPPEPPQPPDDIQQAIEAAYLARMHIDEALRFLGEDV